MAIEEKSVGKIFTDDQKRLISLYEKQIDDSILKFYVEGTKVTVRPEPFPHYHGLGCGCDEKVVNEVLRKYREAGWLIEWYCDPNDMSGTWYFVLNKIKEPFDSKEEKKLKISFTHKDTKSYIIEHKLVIPILGTCKTKIISETKGDQIEYVNLYVPSNLYITDDVIIKFVRYYNDDNRWVVCLQNESIVLENLKVEVI